MLGKWLAVVAVIVGTSLVATARADAANKCYLATSKAAHVLCFLDMTGVSGSAGTSNLTFTMPDGSTLTATLTNTGTVSSPPAAVPLDGLTRFALGNSAYLGVLGEPAFYGAVTGDGSGPMTLSAIKLTDTAGHQLPNVTIAGIDPEDTGMGDGGTNDQNMKTAMTWSTTGTNLAVLEIMPVPPATTNLTPICALTNNGTSAYCDPTNDNPAAAYILTSKLTPTQTFGMSTASVSGRQGNAFAIQLAQLTVAKTISGRENSTDQFQVQLLSPTGTAFATATTSGTATTASVSSGVVPTDTYTLKEVATSGSLANYVSTYTCVNAVTSTTTLPPANSAGTSVTLTPALDDQITCTFTNSALTLTDTAGAAQAIAPGNSVTDTFTLVNTSTVPGTFAIAQPTVVAANGTSLTPTGYVFKGTTYASLAALQSAINAAGATAAGGSIAVGVTYTAPVADGATVVTSLPATITSGTSASTQQSASETDTMPYAELTIVKTGTTTTNAGGPIDYSILVSNAGPNAANGASFLDPFPTGVAVVGTPKCTATGGAVCGAVTVSTATPPTVSSTITTLPSGGSVTFAISATAATGGTYTNTASVSPPAGTGGGTQTSSLTTNVGAASALVKTVRNLNNAGETASSADKGKPGDTLQYVLTFTNPTGGVLSALSFSDPLPTTTTYVSSACPAASTTLPAGITSCTVSTATSGGVTTVTFTFAGTLATGSSVAASINVTIK